LELHGRQPWGARRRGERGGRRRGGRGRSLGAAWGAARGGRGMAWGRHGELLWGLRAALSCVAVLLVVSTVHEKKKRRKKDRRKRKGRKKRKNMKKIPNLKIFREKNKRQFMKLVKKLFLYKKVICLIIIE
jgi:hypothetical protein